MFKILDGRSDFYQWDLDRKIVISDSTINQVHFCNKTSNCSLVVEVYDEDGMRLANVPNILLQTDFPIKVYAYSKDGFTKIEETFKVNRRSKPDGYVYTETEIKHYGDLDKRIAALEENGVPVGVLEEAVARELNNNTQFEPTGKAEIPERSAEGEIKCNVPENASDDTAVNKKYIDDANAAVAAEIKEFEDKIVEAYDKATAVNDIANNALNISGIALQDVRAEEQRATEAERVLTEKLDDVESLALGANGAITFGNYFTMITSLNVMPSDKLTIGQNIMIVTLDVPDLWVSEKADTSAAYGYTSDEDFTDLLKENGSVQVGYFMLSALETQKVDLSEYVKNTDYADVNKPGLVSYEAALGIMAITDERRRNTLCISPADESFINPRTQRYRPITPLYLDYAVMKALSEPIKHEWTDTEKAAACNTIGAVMLQPTTDNRSVVFGANNKGEQVKFTVDAEQSANSVVMRDGYGCVYAAAPKFATHTATKGYVDDNFAAKPGEWIDKIQTNAEGTEFSLSASGAGVYEYVLYVLSSAGTLHAYDSQTLVIGIDGLPDSTRVEKYTNHGNGVETNAFIYRGQFKIDLFITPEESQGFPYAVVFKARKIREV